MYRTLTAMPKFVLIMAILLVVFTILAVFKNKRSK